MRIGIAVLLASALSADSAHAALRVLRLPGTFVGVSALAADPVLPDTMYVAQTNGLVFAVRRGQVLPTPFLDLTGVVTPPGGEQGLLGLAFPRDAASSRRVFVHFNDQAGNTVIARFLRSTANPRVVDPASRMDLQWPAPGGGRQGFIAQPTSMHNGGHLAFGPDAYLYIGLGDGGGDNDPNGHAQNPASLLGKVLRVNVSVPDADPVGYSIPPGNPTFPVANVPAEVWAFGVRNPWRYSFDDLGLGKTDALFMADVGQSAREEIDVELPGPGGRNYGWRAFEGTIPNPNIPPEPLAFLPHTPPVYDYDRSSGWSVIGGYVYRGAALPSAHRGRYFFGDCIFGAVYSLGFTVDSTAGTVTATTRADHTADMGGPFKCITTFARDGDGELYFADIDFAAGGAGRVFKIVDGDTAAPEPPTNLAAQVGGSTIALSWAPSPTGGTTASYVLEAGTAPGLADLGAAPLVTPGLTTGGIPDGSYFVRVRAVGPGGTSAPTPDLQVVVGCSGPPAVPSAFTASLTAGLATFTWTLPPGATRTLLEAGFAPGGVDVVAPFDAPTTAFTVAAPPGTYFLRVRAANACGASGPSAERMLVVP
ncbi:MAG: PQQ-dependent sugar dehydrogenase [Vicinamibacterales bacterium]